MNRNLVTTVVALCAATLTFAACAKDAPGPTSTLPAPVIEDQPMHGNEHAAEEGPATESFATGMMSSYEDCRAMLANDTSTDIKTCAAGIVEASHSSHASAPPAAHEHIAKVVQAAEALQAAPIDDIEKVRLAFGELSKAVVGMLMAAPEAAAQYHAFECPMAKGYKRWVQPTATLANPYMGEKMLTCGKEVHDIHPAMHGDETESAGHAH